MANPTFGLVVIEDRFTADWLGPNGGGGTFDSQYTESGPGPGHPLATVDALEWSPYVTGEQDVDATMRALRAGAHFRGDGASCAIRPTSEVSPSDWRGWDEPVLAVAASAPDAIAYPAGSHSWAQFALTRIGTHEVVVTLAGSTGGSGNASRSWSYDPAQEAWRPQSRDWANEADGLAAPVASVWDPEANRLVWLSGPGAADAGQYLAFRSSSEVSLGEDMRVMSVGWAGADILAQVTPAATARLTLASQRGGSWSGLWYSAGDSLTAQILSSDRGATWSLVETVPTSVATSMRVIEADEGFIVTYINATGRPAARLLPTAGSKFSDGAEIEISTILGEKVWAAVDDDGVVYALWQRQGVNSPAVNLARSLNGGATWELYDDRISIGSEGTAGIEMGIEGVGFAKGQMHLLVTSTQGVGLISLGGWGTIEAATAQDRQSRRLERFGWGGPRSASGEDESGSYLYLAGTQLPTSQGLTAVGTAVGTAATIGGWQLNAVAAGPYTYQTSTGATARNRVAFWGAMELVASTATRSITPTVGYRVDCADDPTPTQGASITISLYTDGIVVRDVLGGATLLDVAVAGMVGRPIHFRGHMEASTTDNVCRASLWYRFGGDGKWTEGFVDATPSMGGGVLNSQLAFGVLQGGQTVTARWKAACITRGAWLSGEQSPLDLHRRSQLGTRGLQFGRVLPPDRAYSCPVLTAGAFEQGSGALRGRGYARASDQVRLPTRYKWAVGHAFPGTSPSPRQQWRATGTSEVLFAWDWQDFDTASVSTPGRWLGEVVALAVVGEPRPRQWQLQVYNGASWDTVGTLDLAIGTGLSFSRTGLTIRPASGASVDRYIHEGELVGGYVSDGTSGARIVRNSGGYWSVAAGVQPVRIETENRGQVLATSGSSLEIVAPRGIACFALTNQDPRYVRVRAAGLQVVPQVYQAGVIAIGRVVGVGASPGWGWRREVELTRQVSRRTDQLLDVRSAGPPRTTLTYEWPEGVLLRELRSISGGLAGDIAYGTGEQIGSAEDAGTIVTNLISGQLDQGRVPCIALPRVPALGATITDPTLWLYGRILSDSHGITGILGTEGTDEVVRVDGLSMEEIR